MSTIAEQVSIAVTFQNYILDVLSYTLAMETDILTDVSRGFPQSFQANTRIVDMP
jgi:hypothetical protein